MEPARKIVKKRSVLVAGRKTSVSLEEPFWLCLKEVATAKDLALRDLITEVSAAPEVVNLSSALRLFVLEYYRSLVIARG